MHFGEQQTTPMDNQKTNAAPTEPRKAKYNSEDLYNYASYTSEAKEDEKKYY